MYTDNQTQPPRSHTLQVVCAPSEVLDQGSDRLATHLLGVVRLCGVAEAHDTGNVNVSVLDLGLVLLVAFLGLETCHELLEEDGSRA